MSGFARVGLLLVLLIVVGVLWQAVAGARDRHVHPARGILVDAGGHRLHLVPTGQGQPGPTVLLETGIGGATAATWAWVQRGVEPFAPVVSYDRAGLGESDPGPMPRDGRELARELHTALGNAGIRPPYVFVGHSYGGLLARLFTEQFPGEVAGVVLVESSHPGQMHKGAMRKYFGTARFLLRLAPTASRIGLVRALLVFVRTDADRLPEPERSEQRAYLASARLWQGVAHEWDSWAKRTAPEAAAAPGFGARPLAVLVAGTSARRFGGWAAMQSSNADLSNDSIQMVVDGATHGSIVADSAYSQNVVRSIHDIVTALRERRTLREIAAADSAGPPSAAASPAAATH